MSSQVGVSLVKYDTPILVSTSAGKKDHNLLPPIEKLKENKNIESDPKSKKELLNAILPPREDSKNGQLWIQYVSSTPATKVDVINLSKDLDTKLQQRQAIETGICPIREELYAQCFDE